MGTFMFVINAVPASTNKECSEIAGAKVHIWVIANNKDIARSRTITYLSEYLWEIVGFEHELEIQPEQISSLHKDEARLYQKALHFGLSADFLAYPKDQGHPGDPVIVKKL